MLRESREEKCSFCNKKMGRNQGMSGKVVQMRYSSCSFMYPINLYLIKPFIDIRTGTLAKNCDDLNRAF